MDMLEDRLSSQKKTLLFTVLLIILTLVVGFLYGFHHILWLNDLHWDYNNAIFVTSMAQGWDVHHHIGLAKEVYERNYIPENLYLAEYKDGKIPFWYHQIQYYLTAFTAKILHLQVYQVIVFMDFVLPACIFLFVYWILYTVSSVRNISILGALFLILTPYLFRLEYLLRVFKRFLSLQGLVPPILAHVHCYNCFARSINPQLVFLFPLASLLFFFKELTTLKKRYVLLSILFGTITLYSYIFFAASLYSFLGIGAVTALVLKDRVYFKHALIILSFNLLFSVPFWYSVFTYSENSMNKMSFGTLNRTPILHPQVWFTLLLCLLIVLCLRRNYVSTLTGIVAFSLLLSGIICLEQHVITGVSVQPNHYSLYVIPQFTIMAIALLAAEWIKKRKGARPSGIWRRIMIFPISNLMLSGGIVLGGLSVLFSPSFVASSLSPDGILVPKVQFLLEMIHFYGVVLGGVLLIAGIILKLRFARLSIHLSTVLYAVIIIYWVGDLGLTLYERYQVYIKPEFGDLQKLAPAVQWLNKHVEKDSVIIGSPDYAATDSVIITYTDLNLYVSMGAAWFPTPPLDEFFDRAFNLMYLLGITSQKDFTETMYTLRKDPPPFEKYQEKLQKELYPELKKYRADYLLYGPREKKNFKVDPGKTYSFLEEVYHDEFVTIYRIR